MEELRRLPPNVRSITIAIGAIAGAVGCLQRVFIEYAESQNSINTKRSKKEISKFMFVDIPDALLTRSTLPTDQGLESYIRSLDNAEVYLELGKVLVWKPIATTSDLNVSLQQRDLLGCLLFRDQQQVP